MEKDNLIYKLHPFTLAYFIFTIFFMSLLYTHPVYLITLFIIICMLIISSENYKEWKGYIRFTIPLVLMIIIINGIFVKAGATVLVTGLRIPVIGKIRITLEAIAYGAGMGIRLLVIISVFCLFTYTVSPDKFIKLFSRFGNKTVFVVVLSIRLFPLMVSDYRRIMEVQRCRGVKFDHAKWTMRLKNMVPNISVLLLSSLERSFAQAESMYARGYGCGKRSIYNKELWRVRDYIIIIMTTIGFIFGIYAYYEGFGNYEYYPKLSVLVLSDVFPIIGIIVPIAFPVILNWGWKKWPTLRLKI